MFTGYDDNFETKHHEITLFIHKQCMIAFFLAIGSGHTGSDEERQYNVLACFFKDLLYEARGEGTQRFIWVNAYSYRSSFLLATFQEQNKVFFFETVI